MVMEDAQRRLGVDMMAACGSKLADGTSIAFALRPENY